MIGRRSASLEVREMEFSALEEFFPGLPLEQRVGLYAVFGAMLVSYNVFKSLALSFRLATARMTTVPR